MARRDQRRRGAAAVEEVEERAARLGITIERILEEYARIAFADLRRIADWAPGDNGLNVKPVGDLDPADTAAIAEIVAGARGGRVYRIKLHDKTPVLGAMGRALGLFPPLKTTATAGETTEDDAESARERLIVAFDRLAGESAAGSDDQDPER